MGGGSSLPLAFIPHFNPAGIPSDAVLVDANDHGCQLARTGLIRTPDFCAVVDRIEGRIRKWKVPIVAGRNFADIRLPDLMGFQAGMTAAYVLWAFGCSPILLAGMDLYDGGTYWHDHNADSAGRSQSVKEHVKRWERIIPVCKGAMFRAINGPLVDLFGKYDPNEPIIPPLPTQEVKEMLAVHFKRVRLLRSYDQFQVGDVVELPIAEVERLIHSGRGAKV